jgi:beta-alanine degradation protein BauB
MKVNKFLSTLAIIITLFPSAANSQSNTASATRDIFNIGYATQKDTAKLNIDGLKASPANFKLLLENEHVRVLEYTLKPSEKDTPHTHPAKSSYIVSGGKIKVYLENGETLIFNEKAGTADWGDYVGKHSVENIGNTTVTIVLTEIKSLQ